MPTLWEKVRVKLGDICEMTAPYLRLYMLFAVFPPFQNFICLCCPYNLEPSIALSFHLNNSYLF